MKIGRSQVDITPAPGGELSGFAVRTQPSTGVLDPLFARVLYLEDGAERLLWVHCDLIGFDAGLADEIREALGARAQVEPERVLLSATHTHSGPPTLTLHECGRYDPAYARHLLRTLLPAVERARDDLRICQLAAAEAPMALAVDRRRKRDAHTDPRAGAVGFRGENGEWLAVIVNHAMHPVALGATNRAISADVPGQVAAALSRRLPGNPLVLVTNGACGNLNPPELNVIPAQVRAWGEEIAQTVAERLTTAPVVAGAKFRVARRRVALELEVCAGAGIDAYARRSLENESFIAAWEDRFRRAVERWARDRHEAEARDGVRSTRELELMTVTLGNVTLITVNAEVFSRFAEAVRRGARGRTYVVSYANGVHGYLPSSVAYAEGGYEVDAAHFFYGGFRYRCGGLERLADEANALIAGRDAAPEPASRS